MRYRLRPGKSDSALFLLSPVSLALLMLLVSLAFTLVPPDVYVYYIRERSLSYLNLGMYIYMVSMTTLFLAGCWFIQKIVKFVPRLQPGMRPIKIFDLTVASTPIFLVIILLNLIYIGGLASQFGLTRLTGFILTPTNAGRVALEAATAGNGLSWLGGVSVAVTGFALWLALNVQAGLWWRKLYLYSNFLILFLVTLFSTLLTQARGPTLLLVLQLAFVTAAALAMRGRLSIRQLIVGGISLLLLASAFWIGVQASRLGTAASTDTLVGTVVGYFPASYNRLAASLQDDLTLPGAGSAYISSRWIYTFPALSNLLDIEGLARSVGLSVPISEYQAWLDSFTAVQSAGLNDSFIWLTVWGAVHTDLGFLASIWWIWYGMVCGWAWLAFQRGQLAGVLIYPYLAVTILQWYADPIFGNRSVPILVILTLVMVFLLKLVSQGPQRPAPFSYRGGSK